MTSNRKPRATAERKAEKISEELCAALLALTTRRLADDIRVRYRCKLSTALHAISLARVGMSRTEGGLDHA